MIKKSILVGFNKAPLCKVKSALRENITFDDGPNSLALIFLPFCSVRSKVALAPKLKPFCIDRV